MIDSKMIDLISNSMVTGYFKVVKALIDKGYTDQINSMNNFKQTPLHRASEFGNFHRFFNYKVSKDENYAKILMKIVVFFFR